MNRLANIILNKSPEECSIQELQQLIHKYPYFNAAHLLLAKKLQFENPDQLNDSFRKATLYFYPLQLNHTISHTGNGELIISQEPGTIIPKAEEPLPEAIVSEAAPITNSLPAETISEEIFSVPGQTSSAVDQVITSNGPETPLIQHPSTVIGQPVHTDLYTRVLSSGDFSSESFANDETPVVAPGTGNEQPASEIQHTASSIPNPASDIQHPAPGNPELLTFEPYHLVDYFASQGIKIVIEDKPTDRFTRQLKSFTEWLKDMKKLPSSENMLTPNTAIEQKVEQLAETSLTNTEIVTEAMAEVWEKQGNPEKAIEIYHKLSLLEPGKSPYFASRISELKKTN